MSQARYTSPAIFLHWLMAIGLVCLFSVGFYMHGLPFSPFKLKIYSWHKWSGVTLFLLVWLRLAWRFAHRPPALPAAMGGAVRAMAHAGHAMLYLLMIAIPLSGWLMSSAKGVQTVYFGVLPLPDLIAPDKALGDSLAGLHTVLNYLLAAVVAGHVAAALKHHLIDRDDVLTRMLPWRVKP
ncbi:cytochrome b [Chromobacterium subtsugae]|uniref:Cytochrome b n=1 Tax=Chromobacterium subtsugae TaxID=251747 RepID=A0ABS7FAI2_9NEIS|nr:MULTISPECIES: cytochrome b [Chromobacterium]KUM02164.1 cytochrome B [Chromobacterium subtsugae]KZE87369.1 cytochrome B [Chromobacterium sp. F49]MBW7565854.1 cytochrome b [Chromobacterium subtsugae]MBW8287106.1 cytochrome b [Chromobacterium subtsugae]OBU88135.1 cytochrome B561 [Chromobacterium subtsugae]